ncbi:MAG TPA: 2-phospho-L-lactate transferase [Candidatus Binataceae bacterium]|nr:2-phospho-L-lactate transferase [Candidatus Binataceae bacterium]
MKPAVTTLAGGVGAAKFLRGLVRRIDPRRLTIVVNTGDDEEFFGLHVSPDIDTVTYTLADVINKANGWGLEGESFNALDALGRYYGKPWFNLGDRDLATHLYRTERMRAGATLSEITSDIAWRFGITARILPMSNDRIRTFVKLKGGRPLPFQEYFVRRRARGRVESIELRGIEEASALPEALRAIADSRAIILAPSNPFVSLAPILNLKGMREALISVRDRVAAISPIVGGKTIKGPADKMLRGLGHEVSPLAVARLYQDFLGAFILDTIDHSYIEPIRELGIRAVATNTIMSTPAKAARLADVVMRALEV